VNLLPGFWLKRGLPGPAKAKLASVNVRADFSQHYKNVLEVCKDWCTLIGQKL